MTTLYGSGILIGVIVYNVFPLWLRHLFSIRVHDALHSLVQVHALTMGTAWLESLVEIGVIMLFWMLGQLIVGAPLIVAILFLRAVSLGLAFALMISAFGMRGVGFDLLAMLPWNILTAGGLIMSATAGCVLARMIFRTGYTAVHGVAFFLYCGVGILSVGLVLCAGLLESALTPHILRLCALTV